MRVIALVIEDQHPEGVSARKLVLETAKHNVISAYDGGYGLELLRRFPNVDIVVVHTLVKHPDFEELLPLLRKVNATVPIIAISPSPAASYAGVDATLPSHEPHRLLLYMAERFGADLRN